MHHPERLPVINHNPTQAYDRAPQHEGIGYRYAVWSLYTEPELSPEQKAHAYEHWATEFETVPPHCEPYAGWATALANSLRRLARHHRDHPISEPIGDNPNNVAPTVTRAQ
jgi:hypothetical protein